jgi:hypothetical protein
MKRATCSGLKILGGWMTLLGYGVSSMLQVFLRVLMKKTVKSRLAD